MNIRLSLYPFSIIYDGITMLRNFFYDKGILTSYEFDVPIINVGNLSVGGTGKTPQIEYLIRLLQTDYKVAVISRGYKRKTKGFLLADNQATPQSIGDEPYQIYQKFKNLIVAVDEDRVNAVQKILKLYKPDVILLDDAFQHRRIKAGLNLLLTPAAKPFFKDFVLPAGNLRENRKNAKRADIVIVTKLAQISNQNIFENFKQKINSYTKAPVFFSKINYAGKVRSSNDSINMSDLTSYQILLVTGIANPKPLYAYLSEKSINFDSLKFGDHHHFSKSDIKQINQKFAQIPSDKKVILTTEKDYVRLKNYFENDLYHLPIQTEIINNQQFNKKIIDYVRNYK